MLLVISDGVTLSTVEAGELPVTITQVDAGKEDEARAMVRAMRSGRGFPRGGLDNLGPLVFNSEDLPR